MDKKTDRRTNTDFYIKTDYTIQDIQTERQTKRQTYLLKDIEKKDRRTYRPKGQTDIRTCRQKDRQTNILAVKQTKINKVT